MSVLHALKSTITRSHNGMWWRLSKQKVKKAKNEDAVGVSATILTKDGYCFPNTFYQNIIK
jgi:hypothetical protein